MIHRSLLIGYFAASMVLAAEKPNIIFINCDDLGYGDVGVFYQNERAAKKDRSIPFFTTPHIDRMADEGLQLRQHYCAAPVCAPSRASLLTGLTQGHAEVRDNQFDKELPDRQTIASVLKHAGYATCIIGKWGLQGKPDEAESEAQAAPPAHGLPTWPAFPTRRGFDEFFGYVRHKDGHNHYPKEDHKQLWHNQRELSSSLDLCFTTDLFTAFSKKWIIEHQKTHPDQPFFLYLAYDTPHAKLQNPPCAYPDGEGLHGGVQWTGKDHAMINTATGTYDGWMHPDYCNATWDHDKNPQTDEAPWPDIQKRYANNVRRIDDCVGDLLALLKDLNLSEHTLVIFTSDNGPSEESYIPRKLYRPDFFHGFGPFEGIKRDTLEGGIRIPAIARWPGTIASGRICNQPNGQWDWLTTFAEAAGMTAPAFSDGVSLMPTLLGHQSDRQRPSTLYIEYSNGDPTPNYPAFDPSHRGKKRGQMQVVITDGYKGLRTAIHSADQDFEIYDLSKDPRELHNLASEPGFDVLQARMKALALQRRLTNPSAPRPYDHERIPASPNPPQGMGMPTLTLKPGSWPWLPDLRSEIGLAANPTGFALPPESLAKAPYAMNLEASVWLPADGTYTFHVTSDSHTMLFVHDIRLLDEERIPSHETRSASLPLKAGWHPINLLYRTGDGKPSLAFELTGPDGTPVPLDQRHLKSSHPGW